MILTILRNSDSEIKGDIKCSDVDFSTSMALADVYFEHAMLMYSLLPKQVKTGNDRKRQFYNLLPILVTITRKQANDIGTSIGLSDRTVGNYLNELIDGGLIVKDQFGKYRRLE